MAFKVVISEGENSHQIEVEAAESKKLIGLKIGEEFDASLVGLTGYKVKITGGSDKNGFPMKKDIDGQRRMKSLLSGGIGFKPKRDGQRRRKTVRGNTISDETVQINTIVTEKGEKDINELLESKE
ncbi:MAG: 30S ribosomal protein S6e [Methanobacterium paludis]|uniref:Small ribosomal subunit protein eS6 n=1 Tax=Methanobacterium paludis (strain DSM 25820 / JCM 18151 / SWAN1) TaxID=868131 RepID=F6D3W5_METPW|nr:30S ribosomal protein S6e [Methanobacterium paludis]AEG18767.1 30S ribosomal protein S6e [Methanobacterium paludis]MCE7697782.1 30S ribosomal protein S6e [Methanobacterium paludis]